MQNASIACHYRGTAHRGDLVLVTIDRLDFPLAAYWRNDFSHVSLGVLMNALAAVQDGILVNRGFLREYGLTEGDTIQLMNELKSQLRKMKITDKIRIDEMFLKYNNNIEFG